MTYTVEAFKWGKDLVAPEVSKIGKETLEDAKNEASRLWENQRCFHVRILSPFDATDSFEHDLHYLKSRPTKDRDLRLFFEKITVPEGVSKIGDYGHANVLRVCDFDFEAPINRLRLPAIEFFCAIDGTGKDQIEIKGSSGGSEPLGLDNLEKCMAAAAFIPSAMVEVMGSDDDYWYFLREVDIKEGRAEFFFSMKEVGIDFIQ